MYNEFCIIGSILSIVYNVSTTKKSDYKEITIIRIIIILMILFFANWIGLVVSIALDINDIKSKLK